ARRGGAHGGGRSARGPRAAAAAMGDGTAWKPRSVEESVDGGVHPAVAAMRLSGATSAPSLSIASLQKLGMTPGSLFPPEKKSRLESPTREEGGKKKKKEKKDKDREKEKKEKKESSSSSGSGSGSSSGSASSSSSSKKKKKKEKKEKKREKKRKKDEAEAGGAGAEDPVPAAGSLQLTVDSCSGDDEGDDQPPAKRKDAEAVRKKLGQEEAEAPAEEAAAVASREPEAPDPNSPALIVQALENRDLSVLDRAVGVLRRGGRSARPWQALLPA
ncbi:unnamed protein product, partial [Prorocentrum cordatum]